MDFKDFWYIAAESRELKKNQVLGRKILGENIALFRDTEGQVVALQDRCLHRSAQLSKGKVFDGQLQCPYHGWVYQGDGQVSHIPVEGPSKPGLSRRCAKKFGVREHQDYIFVRINDLPEEEIEPYRIPFYGEKGWQTVRLINLFKNTVTNCAENFVDIPHTVFVHPTIFRNAKYQKLGASVTRSNGGVFVKYHNETSNLGIFSWFLNPAGHEIIHTDQFEMPNTTHVKYGFGPKRTFYITSQSVPVSEFETLVYTDLTFDYGIWNRFARPIVRKQAQMIIDQDIEILDNQGEMIQKYGQKFSNTSADVIHVLIESIQNELGKGGDPRKLPEKSAEIEFSV